LPVLYTDTSLDEAEMAAWFRAANAMVVTSLADGMNLVAKEFVASRGDLDGTLVLSEFAGAAQDLDGAIIVNPYDIEAIKRAFVSVVEMPASERAARLKTMRTAVHHNDVHRWARNFLNRLHSSARVRTTDLALRPDSTSVGSETVRNLR
jgi:trehalose-6-phosphate synthase